MRRFLLLAVLCYLIGSLPTHSLAGCLARCGNGTASPLALESAMAIGKAGVSLAVSRAWIGGDVALGIAGVSCVAGMGSPLRWWLEGQEMAAAVAHRAPERSIVYPEADGPHLSALALVAAVLAPKPSIVSTAAFLGSLYYGNGFYRSAALAGLVFPAASLAFHGPDVQLALGLCVMVSTTSRLFLVERARAEPPLSAVLGLEHHAVGPRRSSFQARLSRSVLWHFYMGSVLLAAAAYFIYLNRYVYKGFGLCPRTFVKGRCVVDGVALTFDDGPDPTWTPKILDVLKKYGVPATFFVVGKRVREYPEIAWRIVREGHEIGNHTYSHRTFHRIRAQVAAREIQEAERAIIEATSVRPVVFRPPRGFCRRPDLLEVAFSRGYDVVLWSLSSRDWAEVSWLDMTERVLAHVHGGDVILFHDSGGLLGLARGNRANTVRGVEAIVKELLSRGWKFYTISDMMALDARLALQPVEGEVLTAANPPEKTAIFS